MLAIRRFNVFHGRRSIAAICLSALLAVVTVLAGIKATGAKSNVCAAVRNNVVDVKAFDVTGDGSTDDTANIQAAVQCYVNILETDASHSAVLYFPSGTYLLRSQISLVERPKRLDDPSRWQGIVIRGDGSDRTALMIDRPGSGIFALEVPRFSGSIEIASMRLLAAAAGAGAAIRVSSDFNSRPVVGIRQKLDLFVHDMVIAGQGDGYFDYGIHTASIKRMAIDNVKVAAGISKLPVGSACYYLTDTYGPTLTNSECTGMRQGFVGASRVQPRGEGQGFFITKSKFENVDTAIDLETKGSQPGGFIANNVINAAMVGIHLVNKKFIVIHDNEFLSAARHDYVDIYFEAKSHEGRERGNERAIVRNNKFYASAESPRRIGVKFGGRNENMQVISNTFEKLGTGVTVGQGSIGTVLLKNKFVTGRAIEDGGVATYRRD